MATIDLEDIRSYRNRCRSRSHLAAASPCYPRITVDFSLSPEHDTTLPTALPIKWSYLKAEEEIAQVCYSKLNLPRWFNLIPLRLFLFLETLVVCTLIYFQDICTSYFGITNLLKSGNQFFHKLRNVFEI